MLIRVITGPGKTIPRCLLLIIGIFFIFLNASSQKYFQQEVNYEIIVTLNDRLHELNGYENLEYINNSPDTIGFLYFHLWPNAYSGNNTELAKEIFRTEGKSKMFNDPELRGFIDSLDFNTDGIETDWHLLPGSPDICKIILPKPVMPGDTVYISTPFRVKIPKGVTSRFGHIGESYQISQWYPKPAVYDRTGWHEMSYLDQGEFYSEFGKFDVTINLPANYIVAATGNLQNESERQFLDSLATDTAWINKPGYGGGDFPPSSEKMKSLRFIENNIHDFAWFADKRFHVLKGRVNLPETGKEVTTWAMFTDEEAHLWMNSISFINAAITYFSDWCGVYPYNNFVAVQSALSSGAGMEYPGLTVIGIATDSYSLDQVIAHEISHSWFYSALGSNERRYPFLDESLASTYESRYLDERYPEKKLWEITIGNEKLASLFRVKELSAQRALEMEWLVPARKNMEQASNLASEDYKYDNYGSILYYKSGLGFTYLRAYLGDSIFDSIIQEYYRRWKFKHPGPDDMRAIFESGTEKDLIWFFDDFLGTTKRLDYKLARLDKSRILVKNRGEMNSPLLLAEISGDSTVSEKWIDGFSGERWIKTETDNNDLIKIDPGYRMTELFRLNNNISTSGLFKKRDPVQFSFLFTLEDTEKRSLLYTPVLDWNSSDGFMAGIALINGILLPKPVEVIMIPLYSFSKSELTGYGKISVNIIPYNNLIRKAKISIEGEQFGAIDDQDYKRVRIGFEIFFRPQKITTPVNRKVFGYYTAASDLSDLLYFNEADMLSFMQLGYEIRRGSIVNPFRILFLLEAGKAYQKTSAEINYKLSYYGKSNGLEVRLFAGTLLKKDVINDYYAYALSGRGGRELYLYEGFFPDRFGLSSSSFWPRQMDNTEGGIVTHVNQGLGFSNWICSFTLSSSLPGILSRVPVRPFVNLSLADTSPDISGNPHFFYEAGFKAGIWNFFEIYVPLLISDNINSVSGSFKERIRFILKLDSLIPNMD